MPDPLEKDGLLAPAPSNTRGLSVALDALQTAPADDLQVRRVERRPWLEVPQVRVPPVAVRQGLRRDEAPGARRRRRR